MLDVKNNDTAIFILPTNKGIELIDINSIVRVQSISNYSKLFFSNSKTLVVAKVLRWFEECLPADQFIRLHRTHLVNKKFIHQYIYEEGGKVKLVNGERIDVSRRKRSQFLQSWYSSAA